jgi:hypothetical protein
MDFVAQLLKEHSRSNTDKIIKAIGSSKSDFKKIIDIIYQEEPPLPQRASWVLPGVNAKHPALLTPYLPRFIDTIRVFKVDAVKRNMMTVLAVHPIAAHLEGKLVTLCFDLVLAPDETVVVKVHALQAIANVCEKHPELINELKAVIAEQVPKNTAAFSARARHILKKLN